MCIIIDANVAQECCVLTDDARPVMRSVTNGGLKIASGHKLRNELLGCTFRKLYRQLLLAGKIVEYADGDIKRELGDIKRELEKVKKQLCSNDGHIIALARVSGARILFSKDVELHKDFKNQELINNPRGNIYQSKNHEHLLKESGKCRCFS